MARTQSITFSQLRVGVFVLSDFDSGVFDIKFDGRFQPVREKIAAKSAIFAG